MMHSPVGFLVHAVGCQSQHCWPFDPTFTIRRYRVNAPSDIPTFLAARQRLFEGMPMPDCG
jgi:hypothetical protein